MNFNEVKEAEGADFAIPGTKAIFTIASVESDVSKAGKDFLKITFDSAQGGFNHYFYLVEKALSRVQHIWKHSHDGEMLTGDVTPEALVAGFVNKKVGLKLTGRIANNGKSYADLSFGGFACDPTDEALEALEFTKAELRDIDACNSNNEAAVPANADTEIPDESDAF